MGVKNKKNADFEMSPVLAYKTSNQGTSTGGIVIVFLWSYFLYVCISYYSRVSKMIF